MTQTKDSMKIYNMYMEEADDQFKSITGKDAKSGRIVTMIRATQMFANGEIVIGGKSGSPAQHGK